MLDLPGYRVLETIHEGPRSNVFRAEVTGEQSDERSARPFRSIQGNDRVIIKTQHKGARLAREYELGRQFEDERIISFHELIRHGPLVALIQEDFGGVALSERVRDGVSVQESVRIVLQIAEALEVIHEGHLIHQDIHLDNILIHPKTGRIKVIDFGISSKLERMSSRLDPKGPEGNLAYISPEQTGRINRGVDHRTDLYALGVLLYRLLTGQLPFTASDPVELIHSHIAKNPVPPRELNPRIAPIIDHIVMRLLAKSLIERYQSASGIAADLRRYMEEATSDRIPSFDLSVAAGAGTFRIPQRLYGRREEIDTMLESFERVSNGPTELLLVSGYSGVGKSALVGEIQRPVIARRGRFISGKFEAGNRDAAYSALTHAFRNLVRQILSERDDRIQSWRERIQDAVGLNGQLIIDVIPEVEILLGPQPTVAQLGPEEHRNRWNLVLRDFFRVFSDERHPLVLFLDDMQWADAASLNLIKLLLAENEVHHFLLIIAYRDNEVNDRHPAMETLSFIRDKGIPITSISLSTLDEAHVSRLIGDSFGADTESIRSLAETVHQKTGGNPFYLRTFLEDLHDSGCFLYSAHDRLWRWKLDTIRAEQATENVATLLTRKIGQLPTETRAALKSAACLGTVFTLEDLAALCQDDDLTANLETAARIGLILGHGEGWRFVHDRVLEAVLSITPRAEQRRYHRAIGVMLLERTNRADLDDHIFEIVSHLNAGYEIGSPASDERKLARLNLLAGKKARSSAAYEQSRDYLLRGIDLLPPDSWHIEYHQTFELHLLLAECEYLTTNFTRSEELYELMLRHAQSRTDKARVYLLAIPQLANQGRPLDALLCGSEALRLYDIKFDPNPGLPSILRSMMAVKLLLRKKEISSLVDAPEITSPRVLELLSVLSVMGSSAYVHGQEAVVTWILLIVQISLQHGNHPISGFAYAVYAMIEATKLKNAANCRQFAELSKRIIEKFQDQQFRAKTWTVNGAFNQHWYEPAERAIPVLEEAHRVGVSSGDLIFSSYALMLLDTKRILLGYSLKQLRDKIAANHTYIKDKAKEAYSTPLYTTMLGFIDALTTLEDTFVETYRAHDHVDENSTDIAQGVHWAFRAFFSYLFGRYDDALEEIQKSQEYVESGPYSMMLMVEHYCFYTLIIAQQYSRAGRAKRLMYEALIKRNQRKLRRWATDAPDNFACRAALCEAEIARIHGEDLRAVEHFDRAISMSRKRGYTHIEAIANERAAELYIERNRRVSSAYLSEARAAYERWGAARKVNALDQAWSGMLETPVEKTGSLDMTSVLRSARAISSEIDFARLLPRLMHIIIENAGAERGVLLLQRNQALEVIATVRANDVEASEARSGAQGSREIQTTKHGEILIGSGETTPMSESMDLPVSVIRYVFRTGEVVESRDAIAYFTQDTYIAERCPKSLLCMPIQKQSRSMGVLYLENDLTPHTFTEDRLEALNILLAQASISIENAELFDKHLRAQEALRVSEERFRSLVETTSDWIWEVDAKGIYTYASPNVEKLLGYSPAEVVGKTPFHFMPEEEAKRQSSIFVEYVQDRRPIDRLENWTTHRDGRMVLLETSGVPILDADGQLVGYRGIDRDITERHRAEEEKGRLEEQLSQAQKMEAVGRLAGGIAHDFNNLLTVIEGNVSLALMDKPPDPLAKSLEDIQHASNRAAALTRQLLAFSRKQIIEPRVIDLNEVIVMISKMLARVIGENVELETSLNTDLGHVRADPGQLEQIIVNLAVNARDAMPDGGTVTISTRNRDLDEAYSRTHHYVDPGSFVQLDVSDTGCGMDAETKHHIFEPFFTTKSNDKGTGLGLATVYGIVKQHGGSIEVVSEIGQGTTFQIYLPIVEEEPVPVALPRDYSNMPTGTETILFAEDEESLRTLVVQVLRRLGYRVFDAPCGEEALRELERHPTIDLLLTDVVMPGMNGHELAETVREKLPAVRVLFTSGYAEPIVARHGLLEEGMYFIAKPFTPQALANKVREVLESRMVK